MNLLKNNIFLLIIIVLIVISIVFSYYKYIVGGSFEYFLTEEELPDNLDINTYIDNGTN